MNVQVLADPAGRLLWASDALPGAVHDLTAARTHGIPAALTADDVKCWADKAYQGAGPAVRVPFRGLPGRRRVPRVEGRHRRIDQVHRGGPGTARYHLQRGGARVDRHSLVDASRAVHG